MARRFEGRVEVEIEDFGDSPLAERFGIERYPAVFVDEVLIAKPKDFGFFGAGGSQGEGRYTPWLDATNQARFERDLEDVVRQALRGELTAAAGVTPEDEALAALPSFSRRDLEGLELASEDLLGRVTLVEFWATWCPPCLRSLPWLSELQRRHSDDLIVVGIAVESEEADVKRFVASRELEFPVLLGDAELARAFGDVLAVPTLFVFDREGRVLGVVYGAPPDLHERVERLVRLGLGKAE